MPENPNSLHEPIRYLRDSVDAAASAPAAIGWETEEWLRQRERGREHMHELLADESIEAEMQIRDDVPELLGHVLDALRRAV